MTRKKKAEAEEQVVVPVDTKGGVPTSETRILACQCGSTVFDVKSRSKTSISLTCTKCGLASSVKGNVATVRVRQQELTYALSHTIVTPDDSTTAADNERVPGEAKPPETGPPKGIRKYSHYQHVLESIVDKAFEIIRIMNCSDDKFREQTWQGHCLEYLCADFLAGAPPEALQIYDAMQGAEEDAIRLAADAGKKEPTARKLRDLRTKVRDKLAVESGYLPAEFLSEEARQMDLLDGSGEEEGKAEGDESPETGEAVESPLDPNRILDGGRLLRAVTTTLSSYLEDAQGMDPSEIPEFEVLEGNYPTEELLDKWTRQGGYLVRVNGDPRTGDADGRVPAVCAWIAAEPEGIVLDFGIEYDSETDDILGDGVAEVTELLPSQYEVIGADNQWDPPHFADRREVMR